MRAVKLSFVHMLKLIRHDMMLFAAGLAPLLAGVAISFGVPFMEKMLVSYIGAKEILTPYYGLFDIFFASISPAMFGSLPRWSCWRNVTIILTVICSLQAWGERDIWCHGS